MIRCGYHAVLHRQFLVQAKRTQTSKTGELSLKTFGAVAGRNTLTKGEKGFSLLELLVAVAIVGVIAPVIHQLFLVPIHTQARALNFQKAELTASLYALKSSKDGELLEEVPDGCGVELEDEEMDVHTIECSFGIGKAKAKAKSNIFLQKVSLFADNFTDTNSDGYEDATGFPTHYDECYSGWKGNAGSSFKDASCELGGQYLIPLYKSLYE